MHLYVVYLVPTQQQSESHETGAISLDTELELNYYFMELFAMTLILAM